jgi:hypothetical protein
MSVTGGRLFNARSEVVFHQAAVRAQVLHLVIRQGGGRPMAHHRHADAVCWDRQPLMHGPTEDLGVR